MRTCLSTLYLVVLIAVPGCSCGTTPTDSGNAQTDGAIDSSNGRDTSSEAQADSPFEACESLSAGADTRPISLVFVLDTSGSMNCNASMACDTTMSSMFQPTPDPNDSRWDIFRQELAEAIGAFRPDYEVGVYRYPNPATDNQTGTDQDGHPRCIPRTPLVNLALVSDLADLPSQLNVTPEGFTPTHDAVEFGYEMASAARYQDARFVVLATDGEANRCRLCGNCNDDAQTTDNTAMETTVATMRDMGIRTFVIGVPGSDSFRPVLSRLAVAGGTAAAGCDPSMGGVCHFDLTGAANLGTELGSALAQIRQSISSCTFTIPPNPDGVFDPDLVNVVMTRDDGSEVAVPRDTTSTTGWNYSGAMTEVTLYGTFCDEARALRTGGIEISFGCPTIIR